MLLGKTVFERHESRLYLSGRHMPTPRASAGLVRGLFIYLTQDDSLGSDSLDYLRRTAQEEVRRTGEQGDKWND